MEQHKELYVPSKNRSSESVNSAISESIASDPTVNFHVCKKLSSLRDKLILDDAGIPVYFAECHRSSANIELHVGGDKKGPVVAEIYSGPVHGHGYELNFGQQRHSMGRSSRRQSEFSWNIPGHPFPFRWVSARRGNFQLVEGDSDKVLAMFAVNRRIPREREMGKLMVYRTHCEEYGLEFERGVILGGLILLGLRSRAVASAGSVAAGAIII